MGDSAMSCPNCSTECPQNAELFCSKVGPDISTKNIWESRKNLPI